MKIVLTEPERAALRTMWMQGVPFRDIVYEMGYCRHLVRREIQAMGLPHRKVDPATRLFGPDEDQIIRANYGRQPIREWAHLLRNRTPKAIGNRARDYLGLSSRLKGRLPVRRPSPDREAA